MRTVEDLITELPPHEAEIVKMLRAIILSCPGHLTEKLSYNVPYFYGRSRICFIWPSSVPWGKVKKDGVMLGFCRGNILSNDQNVLQMEGRKEVASITFFSPEEINEAVLKEIINEAIIIDEIMAKEKKRKK